jgi:hypothetical protein
MVKKKKEKHILITTKLPTVRVPQRKIGLTVIRHLFSELEEDTLKSRHQGLRGP